jgi:hypothetical protein
MSTIASPSPIGQSFRKIFTREQVEQTARRTGFLQRQSKLDVYLFALTLAVAAVSAQRWSYSQIAAVVHALGGPLVSAQAIEQRLDNGLAVDLLSDLGSQLAKQMAQTTLSIGVQPDCFQAFPAIWATDSTILPLAPILAPTWPGSGGSASPASLKGHFTIDVWSGSTWSYRLTQGTEADSLGPVLQDAPQGTLHLIDQGYSKSRVALSQIDRAQQYFLTPLWLPSPLYLDKDRRLDLQELIRQSEATGRVDQWVWLGPPGQPGSFRVRLVGFVLPPQIVEQRRRRVYKQARKNQRVPQPQTLLLKSWMFFLTNAPLAMLSFEAVCCLYRLRWQVELLFKRFKSLLGLRTMSVYKKEPSVTCQVVAALLAAMMLDEVQEAAYHAWTPGTQREPSLYRMTALLLRLGPLLMWALVCEVQPQRAGSILERIGQILHKLGRMEKRKRRSSRQALFDLQLPTVVCA